MKNRLVERYVLFAVSVICLAALGGCDSPQKGPGHEGARETAAEVMDGEQLYNRHCKMCHSLGPPPKFGPPVKGIAMHYREAFTDKEEAVEHMVTFMQSPDPAMSKCRPQAIERFGLMPAMNLPEGTLRVVSDWFWEQFDPELRHRHGSGHDH